MNYFYKTKIMKKNTFIIASLVALFLWSCGNNHEEAIEQPVPSPTSDKLPETPVFKTETDPEFPVTRHSYKPVELDETQQAINAKLQDFSWKLFKKVYANRAKGSNLMISPISLEIDLGMFINGLEGESLKEMMKTLELEEYSKNDINDYFKTILAGIEQADEAAIFKSANSFWYNYKKTAATGFLTAIQDYYNATAVAVDFGDDKTKDIINSWCAAKTNNRITKMVDRTEPSELFHLMNAVYFKAQWQDQFNKQATEKKPFYYADGKTEDIDMMHEINDALYAETDKFQLSLKSFVDHAFQMVFILPKTDVDLVESIPEVVNSKSLKQMLRNVEVDLYAPKFTSEYLEQNLFQYMMEINPTLRFSSADMNFFEGPKEDVALSAVQKTFFLMDEEGAEAAAVTDIMMKNTAIPMEKEKAVMRLDRPFFYAILESNTYCPLFIGYYGR